MYIKKISLLYIISLLLISCIGANKLDEPIQKNYIQEAYVNSLSQEDLSNELGFQADSDIERLHDLVDYVNLIEEFKEKTGRYPFERTGADNDDVERIVFIATDAQTTVMGEYPGRRFVVKNIAEFIQELESGLEKKISLNFDPQLGATSFPNFYFYAICESKYRFRVSQFYSHSFSHVMPNGYNAVIVSNKRDKKLGHHTLKSLRKNNAFQKVYNKEQKIPDFFIERAQEQHPYDLIDDETGELMYGLLFSEFWIEYNNKTGDVKMNLYDVHPHAIPKFLLDGHPNIIYVVDFYQNRIYSKSFLSNFVSFPPLFQITSDNVTYRDNEKNEEGNQMYHNTVTLKIQKPSWKNFSELLQIIIKSNISVATKDGTTHLTILPGVENHRIIEVSDNIFLLQYADVLEMGLIIMEMPKDDSTIEILMKTVF